MIQTGNITAGKVFEEQSRSYGTGVCSFR